MKIAVIGAGDSVGDTLRKAVAAQKIMEQSQHNHQQAKHKICLHCGGDPIERVNGSNHCQYCDRWW